MDLRALRYFLAVIDHGGITPAADALFVSQPSLSQTMRQLESDLGVELLDRGGRVALPTAAGRELATMARQVLAETDAARERVRQVGALEVGRLVVATASTLAVHPLTPLLARLRRDHPGLEAQVLDGGNPAGVLELLRRGTAELGVVDLPVIDDGWAVRTLPGEEIVLAAAAHIALPDPVPRAAVADLDLGAAVPDLRAGTPLAQTLAGLVGRVRVRSSHRQLLWELVRCGSVVTFVGRRTAEQVLPGVVLRALDPPLVREVGLVWREGSLSPAGEALVRTAEAA